MTQWLISERTLSRQRWMTRASFLTIMHRQILGRVLVFIA
jgi:hypothetical protein